MLAMFRKDLRELAKWAALILVVIAAAILLTRWKHDDTLLSDSANAISSIGCAAGGLLLGLMATVFEARRDSWGFLVHRPATRHRLFAGKALAATVLLWLSAGIPLAATLWWESSPNRRVTPFAWGMGLANLADLLAGTVYLLCGMTIGIRVAKWYGSKILPLAGGILASVFTYLFPSFLVVTSALLAMLLIAATAAWSVFVAGGQSGSTPRPGRVCIGFCAYLALAAMLLIVAKFATETLSNWEDRSFRSAWYDIDRDGQVFRVTAESSHWSTTSFELTDMQGHRMPDTNAWHRNSSEYRDRMADWGYGSFLLPPFRYSYGDTLGHYRSLQHYYHSCDAKLAEPSEQWFYDHRGRRFEVYDQRQRRRLGTLGSDGFVDTGRGLARPVAPGPVPTTSLLINFPAATYRLNGRSRQLEKVFAAPEGEQITDAQLRGYRTSGLVGDFGGQIVVVTQQAIYINDASGKTLVRLPQSQWCGARICRISQLPNEGGWLLLLDQLPGVSDQSTWPSRLLTLDAHGQQLNAQDLPGLPIMQERSTPTGAFVAGGFLVTPAAAACGVLFVWANEADDESTTAFSLTLALRDPDMHRALRWVGFGVFTAAVASWYIGIWYGFSRRRRIAWAAASLFLGWAGVLLLLCVNDRVARRKCPACGKRRMVTHELCEHCGAAWGESERDGTEIMQEMAAATQQEPAGSPG